MAGKRQPDVISRQRIPAAIMDRTTILDEKQAAVTVDEGESWAVTQWRDTRQGDNPHEWKSCADQ